MCGVEALDRYLKQQASQDAKRKIAVTYVLTESNEHAVIGYYTLSSTSVRLEDLPADTAKKFPKYPLVPATLIGRVAVHQKLRGQGFGGKLLIEALHRSWDSSERVGSAAVVVDAKDDEAVRFYARYGFIRFPSMPQRLFLPMKTIEKLF